MDSCFRRNDTAGSCQAMALLCLRQDAKTQRFEIGDAVGHSPFPAAHHHGPASRNCHIVESHFHQGLHNFIHIRIAVVHEGLDKVRQGLVDIPKAHFEEFAAPGGVSDGFHRGTAHEFAPFHPAADTHADADVVAVGDVQRPLVFLEISEDAPGSTTQYGHWRIIEMGADADVEGFGQRYDFFDETWCNCPRFRKKYSYITII